MWFHEDPPPPPSPPCPKSVIFLAAGKKTHYLPEEPFIEELEGEDGMEFPPLPEIPLEDEAVIPPRVIDELLDAPDEVVLASVTGVRGFVGGGGDCLRFACLT